VVSESTVIFDGSEYIKGEQGTEIYTPGVQGTVVSAPELFDLIREELKGEDDGSSD
jgi:hypothetical protein